MILFLSLISLESFRERESFIFLTVKNQRDGDVFLHRFAGFSSASTPGVRALTLASDSFVKRRLGRLFFRQAAASTALILAGFLSGIRWLLQRRIGRLTFILSSFHLRCWVVFFTPDLSVLFV
ncbi:hypothetical protein BRARA_B00048 [Brassica rapa]|uniref:Uncharacterized protein n=1 Tax=Brassica campestris TaxID=3711 RepID=A0A398A4W4_BRACM|nr:hypothetical protein BRARA_B00048 [Brassica rapa]